MWSFLLPDCRTDAPTLGVADLLELFIYRVDYIVLLPHLEVLPFFSWLLLVS